MTLSLDLIHSLIRKIYDKKEYMLFREALRYSLNELYLSGKKRTAYRSAAASYFGQISALARKARATPKKALVKPSVTGSVILEPSGQYALKV